MTLRLPHAARPTTPAFATVAVFALAFAATLGHTAFSQRAAEARLAETARLVGRIGLTDLALFTEARYTRHPSLADLHTPFQDHPMSFEHFPSGIFVAPPTERLVSGAISTEAKDKDQ